MPDLKRIGAIALGLGSIALSLTACIGEPDGVRYTVPVGAGGGNYAPAQPNNAPASAPMVPPPTTDQSHIQGEHLEDPEAQSERMGQTQSETVTAGTLQKATERCKAMAGGRTLQEVRWFQGNQWECIFY